MTITIVTSKDGTSFSGILWEFNPEDGYADITDCFKGDVVRVLFDDCLSMITKNERISINEIGDQDELERAKAQGWIQNDNNIQN